MVSIRFTPTEDPQATIRGTGQTFAAAVGDLLLQIEQRFSHEAVYTNEPLFVALGEIAGGESQAEYSDFSVPEDAFTIVLEA